MVINNSFEQYNICPDQLPSNMNACNNWQNPNTYTADYYHICATLGSGYSTPLNAVGWQQAKDSGAYIGIFCFDKNNPNTRDYVTGQLSTICASNTKYLVSFYVNLSDLSGYSVRSVGAYFTASLPSVSDAFFWPVIPQIENTVTNLNDTMNWVLITDTFTATGGEQYITIGNFRSDLMSDTINNTFPSWGIPGAYYLVDAVSVIPYDSLIGLNELRNNAEDVVIYPNPSCGNFTVDVKKIKGNSQMEIYSPEGKKLREVKITEETKSFSFSISELDDGVYYYKFINEKIVIKTGKIIKME